MALGFLAGRRLVINCEAHATKYVLDHIPLVLFAIHGGHDANSCRPLPPNHTSRSASKLRGEPPAAVQPRQVIDDALSHIVLDFQPLRHHVGGDLNARIVHDLVTTHRTSSARFSMSRRSTCGPLFG
jgi:hypothetical protein